MALTASLLGCGPGVAPPAAAEGSAGTEAASSATTDTTAATTTPDGATSLGADTTAAATGLDEDSGAAFLGSTDLPATDDCNPWVQDCPPGRKCMAVAEEPDGPISGFACVPVVEDPDAVGEPCTLEGPAHRGLDSCEAGAVCLPDPTADGPSCWALCHGSLEQPACDDPDDYCLVQADAALTICVPRCDPLDPTTCQPDQTCIPDHGNFRCVGDDSGDGGNVGDVCEFVNVCHHGQTCVQASAVPGCEPGAVGCCTAFCSLLDAEPSCLPGQACVPWYEDGDAPPGYEHVGACIVT